MFRFEEESGLCIKEFGGRPVVTIVVIPSFKCRIKRGRVITFSHAISLNFSASFHGLSVLGAESVINERRRCCFGLLRSIVHLIAHPVTLTASRGLAWGSLGTTAHKSKVRGFPEG